MHGVVAVQDSDGVWQVDVEATRAKRQSLLQARLDESEDVSSWWQDQRKAVQAVDFAPEVREMYAQSLSFEKLRNEFVSFWQLDSEFAVPEE